MKKYSSKRAKKGKLAYRTPDQFIYQKVQKVSKCKAEKKKTPTHPSPEGSKRKFGRAEGRSKFHSPLRSERPPIEKPIRFIQNPWEIFFWEAFLFCMTLGLGIFTAFKISEILKTQEIALPSISFWQFLLYFLFATCFIFLISRFVKFKPGKGMMFKGIFILAAFWGGSLFFSLWLPDFITLVSMGILVYWWLRKPSIFIHDLLVILGLVGIGATLGLSLSSQTVVLLLIIFSIYDFIAVYKTKHMIKMAKEMIEAGSILGIILPQRISDLKQHLKGVRPGGKFLILGGGDIAFPLLLCASLVSEGITDSLIVAIFALAGLSVSFWVFVSQKRRQPIPALPPIALFSISGYLLTLII